MAAGQMKYRKYKSEQYNKCRGEMHVCFLNRCISKNLISVIICALLIIFKTWQDDRGLNGISFMIHLKST